MGFPGETEADVAELHRFLSEAGLDAIGVFGYSDEDGTEAATLDGQLDPAEIARRVDELADLAEEMMAQRAADRVGEMVEVLIEEDLGDGRYLGRAAHQAPEVDGTTTVRGAPGAALGDIVAAGVTGCDGVDLGGRAASPRPGLLPGRCGHALSQPAGTAPRRGGALRRAAPARRRAAARAGQRGQRADRAAPGAGAGLRAAPAWPGGTGAGGSRRSRCSWSPRSPTCWTAGWPGGAA